MKRFLTILVTVLLLCASILTTHVIMAEDPSVSEETVSSTQTETVEEKDEEIDEVFEQAEVIPEEKESEEESAIFDETQETEVVTETDTLPVTEETENVEETENISEKNKKTPEDGFAYAVLMDEGDLVFFRSLDTYENNTIRRVSDIIGNTYEGIVFADVESGNYFWGEAPWYTERESIKNVYVADQQTIRPRQMSYMFYDLSEMVSFDSEGFDTSSVSQMDWMFMDCISLIDVDVSHFDTSNVRYMSGMFHTCSSLKQIDITGFDTCKVENAWNMFYNCSSLESIDLSHFDTGSMTDMSGLFHGCSSLKTVDVSLFDTSNASDISSMFRNCTSLKTLDLSNFNTDQVTSFWCLVHGCTSLRELDLSSFNTGNAVQMDAMFWNCQSLTKVWLGENFSRWIEDSHLPEGTWSNEALGLSMSENDLYNDYPEHASEWTGLWTRNVTAKWMNLNPSQFDMYPGQTLQLSVSTNPEIAIESGLSYVSSNESAAVVDDNGLVTAVSSGTAVITVSINDGSGLSRTCCINVVSDSVPENGYAYAILEDDGDLIFFRSLYSYTHNTRTDIEDIEGNRYSGFVYSSVELGYHHEIPWSDKSRQAKAVKSDADQMIRLVDTSYFFYRCENLITVDFSGFDTSSVQSMTDMFGKSDNFSKVVFGENFTVWKDNTYLPSGTWINKDRGLSKTETELYEEYRNDPTGYNGTWTKRQSYAVLTSDGDLIFFNSDEYYENKSTQQVTDVLGNKYYGTVYSGFGTVDYFNENPNRTTPWYTKNHKILRVCVAEGQTIKPKNMSYWFDSCRNLVSFDSEGFDTSETEQMNSLFGSCSSLADLDLSHFDTGNVWSMWSAFRGCSALTELDITNFDTSKVRSMEWLFEDCSSLTEIDLSYFDTSSSTSLRALFTRCSSLKEIDLSGFDTSNVTDIGWLFWGCTSLKEIDLSNFDTSNVTNMPEVFKACSSLEYINLSSFDTSKVTWNNENNPDGMMNMFAGCESLVKVDLGDGFTKWTNEAYLPSGNWTNEEVGLTKTETELYEQYPSHASEWAGTWERMEDSNYIRIYRESRLEESIVTANELKEVLDIDRFNAIIVATDSGFADALSGSSLAARKNAPILLINSSNYEEAQDYIRSNLETNGGTVYILGSESAVSSSFEEGLSGFNVTRLAGSSRYMTNLDILNAAGLTDSRDIFVVTGGGFADSLSSASAGLPILMVDNSKTSLKNSQIKWLKENNINNIYILGQEASVNASLAKALKSYCKKVTRIGGDSRWITTKLVADQFFPEADYVTLATGADYADGLIASPLAYALKSPLLMVASNKTTNAKAYVQDKGVTKAYIIGSKDRISDEAARKILCIDDTVVITER